MIFTDKKKILLFCVIIWYPVCFKRKKNLKKVVLYNVFCKYFNGVEYLVLFDTCSKKNFLYQKLLQFITDKD